MKKSKIKKEDLLLAQYEKSLKKLEKLKEVYSEIDYVTGQLVKMKFKKNEKFIMIDNFETASVVFRPAAVRRFELKVRK